MSDMENHLEDLSESLENQHLGPDTVHRRGSNSSESSLASASKVAGTKRRPAREQKSQKEGPPRKMSRKFPKTTQGCDTCKKRHVKCDEEKPKCGNCTKSGKECLGYHPPIPNIFHPRPPRSPSTERLCNGFIARTARRLSSYPLQLNLEFWQVTVPKLAEQYPPIQHAMLALAARQEADQQLSRSTQENEAQEQYVQALGKFCSNVFPESISDDVFLVCCLLLILYHLWDFNLLECFRHVSISLWRYENPNSVSSTDEYRQMLLPAFQHFANCGTTLLDDLDEQKYTTYNKFAQVLDIPIPTIFAQADEAYAIMERAVGQIARLDASAPGILLTNLSNYLMLLRLALEQTLACTEVDSTFAADLRMLLVHDRAASVLLSGLVTESQMIYNPDQHIIDFDFIISELEDLLQIQDTAGRPDVCTRGVWLGIIPPLFLVATRCQNFSLRQRAIDLMHVAPHKEYIWTSCMARRIAIEVVRFQTNYSLDLDTASFSNIDSRISLRGIKFNAKDYQINLDFEVQTVMGSHFEFSAIPWQSEIDPQPIGPFEMPQDMMPQAMVRACGYSKLMLSFRDTEYQCGTEAAVIGGSHIQESIPK